MEFNIHASILHDNTKIIVKYKILILQYNMICVNKYEL